MTADDNVGLVRRYFAALDRGDLDALDDLFSPDCRIHRPGLAAPLTGLAAIRQVVANAKARYRTLSTEIEMIFGAGDRVACRATHRVIMAGEWPTRIGTFDVPGKPLTWHPIVLFRIEGGRIAEEWVCRDELGMLIDLGVLT